MAGDPRAHNVDSREAALESLELPPPADPSRLAIGPDTGGRACGMPPGSALIYVFDGVDFAD